MAVVKSLYNIFILEWTDFAQVEVIDNYTSFIWVNSYDGYGTFEIYLGIKEATKAGKLDSLLETAIKGNYIWFGGEPNRLGLIETRKIVTSVENGNMLLISGRTLESVLGHRVISNQVMYTGNLQAAIRNIVNVNFTSSPVAARNISYLATIGNGDTSITALTVNTQFTGQICYNAIRDLCMANELGFQILWYPDGYNNGQYKWIFSIYKGEDRSYAQDKNQYVIFSEKFDNLIRFVYSEDHRNYVNTVFVAGEGEGSARKIRSEVRPGVDTAQLYGILRREGWIDARDISSTVDGGTLTNAQYQALLTARAKEKFPEMDKSETLDSEIEPDVMFTYGVDYFLGDIVQVENKFGMSHRARIQSVIWAHDTQNGLSVIPTFKTLDTTED